MLGEVRSLNQVLLSDNQFSSVEAAKHLGNIENLTEIDLENNPVIEKEGFANAVWER